jgi:hypothetical protein
LLLSVDRKSGLSKNSSPGRSRNVSAARRAARSSVKSSPLWRTIHPTARYNNPVSKTGQPNSRPRRRASVPLPLAFGPSMAMIKDGVAMVLCV